MYYYSTNIMGPSQSWYTTNNISPDLQYMGGRIDIDCEDDDYGKYGYEIPLPIMLYNQDFIDWVDNLATSHLISIETLIELYQSKTKTKLQLYKDTHAD